VGNVGLPAFGSRPLAYFVDDARWAQATPIPGASLAPGDGIVVVSNGGAVAKVLVMANAGGFLSLRFTTFGISAPAGVPTIIQVVNNSSFIPPGYPNYGIPPSSLFVVAGAGLADPGGPVLQSSAPPGIPLTLNGASITVVVKGVTTHPALYYTSPTQVAAVLPAATPVGIGTLTLIHNGVASAPAPIEVTPSAVGINSYSGSQGVVTDAATGALLTYANSGQPGQAVVIWSTGLGADPADSDSIFSTTPHAVSTPLQVYVGGVLATILYQGSSGYPGVNQINIFIPASAPRGCWVPLTAITGTVVSNIVTIPINPGGGACTDPLTSLSGNQIAPAGGGPLRTGLVSLIYVNEPARNGARRVTESANGAFIRYTGLYAPPWPLSPGGCILQDLTPVPFPGLAPLDVGQMSLTGPGGLSMRLGPQAGVRGSFSTQLPAGSIPSTGGTYTFQGLGGMDVGPFSTSLTLTNPVLAWTNRGAAATVDRRSGAGAAGDVDGRQPGNVRLRHGNGDFHRFGAGARLHLHGLGRRRPVQRARLHTARTAGRHRRGRAPERRLWHSPGHGVGYQSDGRGGLVYGGLDLPLSAGERLAVCARRADIRQCRFPVALDRQISKADDPHQGVVLHHRQPPDRLLAH
jgi:uncharacterized protein (TIGR03437 family)